MHPAEVVVHMEDRQHVNMVLDFLAERIGQPSEAAHTHPHVEVLALHIAGRYMVLIGVTADGDTLGAKTLRRAVPSLAFGIVAVNLYQLREVDARSEGIGNGS
jgi:hypothetical protein